MLSLTSLGLSRTEAVELLTHPTISAAHSDKNVLDGLYDASDRPEEGSVIVWWNNLEKDSRCVELSYFPSFLDVNLVCY
jgi:UDP-glucose:glycoprotein glucosyltransferase